MPAEGALSWGRMAFRLSVRLRGSSFASATVLALALALGPGGVLTACSRPNRAMAPGYAGDDETSGKEQAKAEPVELDDDDRIKGMFLELGDAQRIRTCAPAKAPWVIIAYTPEVLDQHRVRTREIHCQERIISDRCQLLSELRYYLDDPNEYFSVDAKVKPERALEIAELARESNQDGRLLGIAADKGGVYLTTRGDCGVETQLVVRMKGSASKRRLEVIGTRYHVEL
jgi:hypothetical protein